MSHSHLKRVRLTQRQGTVERTLENFFDKWLVSLNRMPEADDVEIVGATEVPVFNRLSTRDGEFATATIRN